MLPAWRQEKRTACAVLFSLPERMAHRWHAPGWALRCYRARVMAHTGAFPRPAVALITMKHVFLILLSACAAAVTQAAEDRIYRCGNEYTNTVTEAQAKSCKLISGGNVTVVQSVKPPVVVRPASPQPQPQAARVDAADQRARDSDARWILEQELKKAELRQQELLREYNGGEPEKLGPETRNYQKYLDRVGELRAAMARNDADIAGIRRELGRSAASNTPIGTR